MLRIIKHIGINTSVVIVTCLIFLFSAELAMRFVWTGWKDAYDERRYFQYADKEAYEGWYWRFRQAIPFPKGPNVFRILVLGDSFSKGIGIARANDTWPRILEQRLNAKLLNGKRVEVINLAHSGLTTVNEYEVLEVLGWKIKPDLIILQFYINDSLPSRPLLKSMNEYEFWKIQNLIQSPKLHAFLERHSYFYTFLNEYYRKAEMKSLNKGDYHALFQDDFIGWRQCQAALFSLAESAVKRGVKVVFVSFPMFTVGAYSRETYPFTDIHDKVMKTARLFRFVSLDLLDVFIAQHKDFKYWWALRLDGHPNKQAHQIAARAIEYVILSKGLMSVN